MASVKKQLNKLLIVRNKFPFSKDRLWLIVVGDRPNTIASLSLAPHQRPLAGR
jgi:hypothetical protein